MKWLLSQLPVIRFNSKESLFSFHVPRTLFLSLLLCACAGTDLAKQVKPISLEVKELDSGMGYSRTIHREHMPESPSSKRAFSDNFRIVEQSDTVPARLGQKFGVIFQMDSDIDQLLEVEQVWIFPSPIRLADGREYKEVRYKISKPTNEPTYSLYELESQYELVKGEWMYQMFYQEKKIFEKKFLLK
jgi:hypothetical protein